MSRPLSPVLLWCSTCVLGVFSTTAGWAQFEVDTKHTNLDTGAAVAPQGARKPGAADAQPIAPTDVDVDPFWLGTIQHRSLGVRDVESDAYYKVLDHARQTDTSLQKKVAADNIARHEQQYRARPENARMKFSLFADVFTHPEEYTGELLTMRGYIRKNLQHPADPEDPRPAATYEAWLYTPDSQHNPVVVVYSELPKGMPLGGNLVETIEVTGYFFKVYGYRAQDGLRAAPMLLAKTLEWSPRVVKDTTWERILYFGVTGFLVVGLIFVFWRVNWAGHRRLSQATLEPADFDPRELQSLDLETIGHTQSAPTSEPSS